ncbi:hypothetical protein Tco_1166316 [Tanacetum coccineum]
MSNSTIRSILKKDKLNGRNFLDWYRNLRIILMSEQKLNHMEEALPEAPPFTATAIVRNAYTCRFNEQQEIACLMLEFHAFKQKEGQCISTYVLKMKGYLDQMERLGYPIPLVLRLNLILTLLSKDYEQFVQNYNMHSMGKTITELHVRHWRRNYPLYLAELKKRKANTSGKSNIFTIELYSFPKTNY